MPRNRPVCVPVEVVVVEHLLDVLAVTRLDLVFGHMRLLLAELLGWRH